MAKTDAFENALLDLIFDNVALAGIGDASGLQPSAADGSLYFSLHTADPGEAGNQTTSEISYTGYARVAVSRTAGFTVTGNSVSPSAAVTFGQRTDAGSATATFFGVGTDSAGTGNLLYKGQITTPGGGIVVSQNVTPELTTATAITES